MRKSTKISFYGGINEIGGNKFLVEDKGTRVFLDFGMQMEKVNMYYSDFLQPRNLNGMNDLFEFDLLPRLTGLYRRDYSKHTNYGDHDERTGFDAVLLTHAHLDHAAYIHYLRPDITIYCTEATKLVLQAMQDTGGDFEYITYKANFKIYRDEKGKWHRARVYAVVYAIGLAQNSWLRKDEEILQQSLSLPAAAAPGRYPSASDFARMSVEEGTNVLLRTAFSASTSPKGFHFAWAHVGMLMHTCRS